jgi:PhnB protein
MAKKIDPLNKKNYGAVTAMLTVSDVKGAMAFYQKAFGFAKRGLMNGPGGEPMHAELRLRDTTLMLGPEFPAQGMKGPSTLGGTPVNLYVLVENADKVFAKAVKLGASVVMPVKEQFWGDRAGMLVDPFGHSWMVATHAAEPTMAEMKRKMKAEMAAARAQEAVLPGEPS